MLSARDLSRSFGALRAVADVSFAVGAGEIVGLLGANGAGKSTVLRICAGLLTPDAGIVRIDGVALWDDLREGRRRLGYAAEEPVFYEELSGQEYLEFLAGMRRLDPTAARARAGALAERLGLLARWNEPVERYSHGMRKKLSFLAALLHEPPVLLCDEALDGFDAAGALEAKSILAERARAGTAVLFSSHVTETIERLCDRVVVLHHGRVARELGRAAWGAPAAGPSPLERIFLDVARVTSPQAS